MPRKACTLLYLELKDLTCQKPLEAFTEAGSCRGWQPKPRSEHTPTSKMQPIPLSQNQRKASAQEIGAQRALRAHYYCFDGYYYCCLYYDYCDFYYYC